jgi:hypothetical protein
MSGCCLASLISFDSDCEHFPSYVRQYLDIFGRFLLLQVSYDWDITSGCISVHMLRAQSTGKLQCRPEKLAKNLMHRHQQGRKLMVSGCMLTLLRVAQSTLVTFM